MKVYTVSVQLQPQDDISAKLEQFYNRLLMGETDDDTKADANPLETSQAVHND